MSERKVVGKNFAIILGIICIILALSLIGAVMNYSLIIKEKDGVIASLNSQIIGKDSQVEDLQSQITNLQNQVDSLNATCNWLKQHSFTYYVVQNSVNISNVQIYGGGWMWYLYYLNGTVTNIGTKPLEKVYIYAILVNPDGMRDFSPDRYTVVTDLWVGEIATFTIGLEGYKENQTVEFFVITCY
jgi:hypothetical protein